ncbi:MAG: hypothetical protein HY717_16745 [Planctomycetes bacterium]|nr:hypothetical protein [Planctomycetota bacterium]
MFLVLGLASGQELPIPAGPEPAPVELPHFPRRLDAYVFRNWGVAPLERIAAAIDAGPEAVRSLARDLGLGEPPPVSEEAWRRSALTAIRRNWHLLPYPQLLKLLGWREGQLGYTLREDDFLWIKLGNLKPRCEPVRFEEAGEAVKERQRAIRKLVEEALGEKGWSGIAPRFSFLQELASPERPSAEPGPPAGSPPRETRFAVRFLHSYFALYGDALLEPALDPYPDGYLERLSRLGVNGVWLPALLRNLAPPGEELGLVPAGPETAAGREARLRNLARLVERAGRFGVGVYLYLNEPRAMPLEFFKKQPSLQGVQEGDAAALCSSAPAVQKWLAGSVEYLFKRVPGLAGVFTITMSENLTNCHSHGNGKGCPRCRERPGPEVVGEVNRLIAEAARKASPQARAIVWDWGWPDDWIEPIIKNLPKGVSVMSVSEWSLPIERGGVKSQVGEYSISAVGPGPRARRTWSLARQSGLEAFAKIQAGNTWELSAVPYIPAVGLVAEHARRLAAEGVQGLMLGWTLGGYPSPNLQAVQHYLYRDAPAGPPSPPPSASEVLERVAARRFGSRLGGAVAGAWRGMSQAFEEYPFHVGVVYRCPAQLGPANLLHARKTGYAATMVGFPYDDLDGWRGPYPPEAFAAQLEKVAAGWGKTISALPPAEPAGPPEYAAELSVMKAAHLHVQSVASQSRFVLARRRLEQAVDQKEAAAGKAALDDLARIAGEEERAARRLLDLVRSDSRLGFEASNQYYYMPVDLLEKVLNCRWILDDWIPGERRRLKSP